MNNAPKTAVLWMPAGQGKSRHAQAIATLLGCEKIVDEWSPGDYLEDGALHLTNAQINESFQPKLSTSALMLLENCLHEREFWTVPELIAHCGLAATPDLEGALRVQLERTGCKRAKRSMADGNRYWGYVSPHFKAGCPASDPNAVAHLAGLHTPEALLPASGQCDRLCRSTDDQPARLQPAAPPAPTFEDQSFPVAYGPRPVDGCDAASVLKGGAA